MNNKHQSGIYQFPNHKQNTKINQVVNYTYTAKIKFVLPLLLLLVPFTVHDANAYEFEVKVTIDELLAQVSFDEFSETDFYAVVTIDGTTTNNYGTPGQQALEGNDSIEPGLLNTGASDWSFTKLVDPTQGTVSITIKIFDEDDFLNGNDDQADIENGPGTNVDITLDLKTCTFSGELSGACGVSIQSAGNGEADGNATLDFTVEIVGFNESGGVHVHCMHDPIWPQPGDTVTITAIALGDNLKPKVVDEISFTQGTSTSVSEENDTPVASYTAGPFSGTGNETEFDYSCTALNDANNDDNFDPDEVAFSGYRKVSVGVPEGSQAVPVIKSGFENSVFDVILIPDTGYSSAAMDPVFLQDAKNMIDLYYQSGLVFLDNQAQVSFWIAQDSGSAGGYVDPTCTRVPPNNWSTDYTFSNAGLILHRINLRDCASAGVATAQTVQFVNNTLVPFKPVVGFSPFTHELSHALFSLADEYCNTRVGANPNSSCDGGYRVISVKPNLFSNAADCEAAKASDPNGGSKTCQSFVSQANKTSGQTFFTFDPPAKDLMVDKKLPQFLDNDRIKYVFDNCLGC